MDAAEKAGVKHLILSALPSALELSGKSFLAMEGKAKAEKYMFESGVPATAVWYSFYYDNILTILKPRKTGNDKYMWGMLGSVI